MLQSAVVICLFLVPSGEPQARSVVVTTDCGADVDDQWVITHLALIPEMDFKGIVTTHAPGFEAPAAETSARLARRVLERARIDKKIPVLAGSSEPLVDETTPGRNPGVEFLLERSRGFSSKNRLVVLILGAATDAASALLIDPSWADRVEIVAMGFNGWPEGGDVWNVRNDSHAWRVLLQSKAPLVVGDARVTAKHLKMTRDRARSMLEPIGATGTSLAEMLVDWLDRHPTLARDMTGDRETWPIWDEVVVAYLLGMTKSEMRPRPAMRSDLTFEKSRPIGGSIAWITEIDDKRLWTDLKDRLERAEKRAH